MAPCEALPHPFNLRYERRLPPVEVALVAEVILLVFTSIRQAIEFFIWGDPEMHSHNTNTWGCEMMGNWTIWEIAEQVQLAARMSREVEDNLVAPDTMRPAAVLLEEISHIASEHERVLARLSVEVSPLDPSLEIAEKLADHWRLLSTALAARITELEAVDFPGAGVGTLPSSQPGA